MGWKFAQDNSVGLGHADDIRREVADVVIENEQDRILGCRLGLLNKVSHSFQ